MTSLLLAIAITAVGQDKIYTTSGGTIEAKVQSIMPLKVIYKRFDNQAGPEYNLPKKEIIKIVYQNGTTDVFNPQLDRSDSRHGNTNAKKYQTKSDI